MSYADDSCVMCGDSRRGLPYTCRACWTSLGNEGQRAFYARAAKGTIRGITWLTSRGKEYQSWQQPRKS